MHATYTPTNHNPRPLAAALLAIAAALAFFAVLPLLHIANEALRPPKEILPPTAFDEIPETIAEIPPPVVKAPPEKKIDLEPPRPPMTIRSLEVVINATGDGSLSGLPTGLIDIGEFEEIFDLDAVDEKPSVLVAVSPRSPLGMARERAEVVVEFVIDELGRPERIRIVASSRREFETAAIEAVKRSKWKPGAVAGEPVKTRVRLPVLFNPRS